MYLLQCISGNIMPARERQRHASKYAREAHTEKFFFTLSTLSDLCSISSYKSWHKHHHPPTYAFSAFLNYSGNQSWHAWTIKRANCNKQTKQCNRRWARETLLGSDLFLKIPETFRVYFGCHRIPSIFSQRRVSKPSNFVILLFFLALKPR